MSIKENNATIVSACNQRLVALGKYVKAKTVMSINGEPTKLADLIGVYQAGIDTRAALVAKRAELDTVLAARDSAETKRQASDKGLKAWVATQFGASSQQATEFGFSTPRIGAKTAETVFKGVLQAQATRDARGTKGKKAKEQIKGAPVVLSVAPANPAIIATAAAPAAVAPTATNGTPSGAPPSNGTVAHS